MKKKWRILKIIAYHNGIEIGSCNYTSLKEVSNESARYFTFRDFEIKNKTTIDNSGYSLINISIFIKNIYEGII